MIGGSPIRSGGVSARTGPAVAIADRDGQQVVCLPHLVQVIQVDVGQQRGDDPARGVPVWGCNTCSPGEHTRAKPPGNKAPRPAVRRPAPAPSQGVGKEGRVLRIETVINKPHDIGVLARLEHLPELVAKAQAVNGRLLMIEHSSVGRRLMKHRDTQASSSQELRTVVTVNTC
jgi:hypothetical protein